LQTFPKHPSSKPLPQIQFPAPPKGKKRRREGKNTALIKFAREEEKKNESKQQLKEERHRVRGASSLRLGGKKSAMEKRCTAET
jgi:hypothetical protein